MNTKELYYVQDMRSYAGNFMYWWRISDCGYTTDINEAKRFTYEEAMNTVNQSPHKYMAWKCSYIDSMPKSTVIDRQYLSISDGEINPDDM